MQQGNISILYNSKCECCGGYMNESTTNIFQEADIDNFIEGVYTGLYDEDNLPEWYYVLVATILFSAVEAGFGLTLAEATEGSLEYEYLIAMRENVYIFSAAKTYQQVREMRALLAQYGDNEALFKEEAIKIFNTYNTPKGANYLSVEYKSAKRQAEAAKQWLTIEATKGDKGCLRYKTREDNRVRPEHRTLNNVKEPIDNPFWDVYYPPNGWACRCFVVQEDCGLNNAFSNPLEHNVPEAFQFNSGKERKVFSPKHPYFDVAKGDRKLAKRNFNLPLV